MRPSREATGSPLLVAQRLDRKQVRRATGRPESEESSLGRVGHSQNRDLEGAPVRGVRGPPAQHSPGGSDNHQSVSSCGGVRDRRRELVPGTRHHGLGARIRVELPLAA